MVLKRGFIYDKSKTFFKNGFKIQDAFNSKCPALEPIHKLDCTHSYSALQYIEGLYLVEKLVQEAVNAGTREVNLIFALPDDEWKYYFDNSNSFLQDVKNLLGSKLGDKIADKKINIEFCTFTYGDKRPYNDGVQEIEKIELSDLQ